MEKTNTIENGKKKNKILNDIKKWTSANFIVIIYMFFSILMELISVYAVEKTVFMRQPYIYIAIIVIISSLMLMIKKNFIRFLVCGIILIGQVITDLIFVVVYDMTGQYFDYGMLSLRNDAMGILESIPMNFIAFYAALFFCICFVVFGNRHIRRKKTIEVSLKQRLSYLVICILSIVMLYVSLEKKNSIKVDRYEEMLNSTQSSNYASLGLIGNFVNELAKGIVFNETKYIDSDEINQFLYQNVSEKSPKFGVSKDNNVIVILSESFEWFSFIKNSEYPNGLDLSEDDYKYLFPNLTRLYGEGVVLDNFHSKEKTDISETLSILGSYPTDAYVDYDYENNTMPQTVPNILKLLTDGEIQTRSFHDGYKTFYNRDKTHKAFGFESLTDSYDMYDISKKYVDENKGAKPIMHDYMSQGERNLDSEMINTCKDLMFPTDKRFYTYITSITMHGIYYERDNLSEYMKKLTSVYKPKKNDKNEEILMNYMTTVMEFDHAIGMMMDDLNDKGLLDHTTILMFGDHNAYYQQLSNYVKDIYDYDTDNYFTDLYKVPLMIYDQNLEHQVISKFTCTSDIVPTLFDLLGINTYENMYYGHSAFSSEQSVLYSRAYNFFAGDGIVCRSLNNMLYLNKSVTEDEHEQFNEEAKKLVEKIKYCDQIFYQDYFSDSSNLQIFKQKIKEIQD